MNNLFETVSKQLSQKNKNKKSSGISGSVLSVKDGVAEIFGLENDCFMSEVVEFESGEKGLILNIEEYSIKALILGDEKKVKVNSQVFKTDEVPSIPVNDEILGRVLDPLGRALDGKPDITQGKKYIMDRKAPGVMPRKSVSEPMMTGITGIDGLIPIGRGQRELIIGDRQTGKTAIAIDTIINQKDQDMICIYVAIGQKESKIAQMVEFLKSKNAFDHVVVVSAGASKPAVLQYLAPYSGTAIGEYFMEKGKDALIVYDDLSKHAQAYRQMSLLLRRPPGREAYPGDVFYLHSRLLERSARLNEKNGGGSLTSLPIIETQAGDVSAYIPTNVISITDGQIFLESDLFYSGQRPAINMGLSVSRVGSSAQTKIMKKVAGKLKIELAQFRDLEAFAQFGSDDLDKSTQEKIKSGKILMRILRQNMGEPRKLWQHVILVFAGTGGHFNDTDLENISEKSKELLEFISLEHSDLIKKIQNEKNMTDEIAKMIKTCLEEFFSREN